MFIFLFFKKKIDLKIEIVNLIKVKGNFIKFNVKRGIGIISNLYFFLLINLLPRLSNIKKTSKFSFK